MQTIPDIIEQKICPALRAHHGDIELVEVTADGWVKVKLTGACSSCPGAQQTLSEFVENVLREYCPAVKGVIAGQQVSEELIAEALRLLRKGRHE